MVCYGSGEYLPEQALGIQNPHSKKILTAKYNTKKKLRKILKLLKKVLLASFLFGIKVWVMMYISDLTPRSWTFIFYHAFI